jgi:tetratricopeptide (TPR) repeat protein
MKVPSHLSRLFGACLALMTSLVQAQMFKDAELAALHRIERPAERLTALGQRAAERLTRQPDDTQALLALALAATGERDAARRESAIQRLQACTERLPQAVECQYGFAAAMGTHALSQGMFKAMGSAGRIREAFVRAVELEPLWFPARSGLLEFYLQAPAVAGGSVAKARELVRAVAAERPAQARLLEARVALHDKQWDAAHKSLAAYRDGPDADLNRSARDSGVALAFTLLNEGLPERARPLFERLTRERADAAIGPYGLGRVATDLGQHEEAVKLLRQAATLKDADLLPVDYRLALALLGQGQREAARAALQRFLASAGPWSKATEEAARKKLAELGA